VAWYGESYQLYGGGVLAGSAVDFSDWYDHYDDTSHTLTAGDDVIVGSYADPADSTEFAAFADPIEVRWVIEVLSGSGTLELSAGLDPDWAFENPGLATQTLGTLTAAGAGTLVSAPVTVVDHAELIAQTSAVIARIQCTSGSIDVAQVKLRVWPTAGVAGAWVPAGDGTAVNAAVRRWNDLGVPDSNETGLLVENINDPASYPDPDGAEDVALDAQLLAIDDLASKVGATANFGSVTTAHTGEIAASQNGTGALLYVVFASPNQYYYTGEAYIRSNPGIIKADIANAVPDVVTNGIDPHEHRYETEAYVRPAGGGPLVPEFGGWTTAAVEVTFSTSDPTAWATGPAVLQQHDIDPDFEPTIDPVLGYSQMPYQVYTGGAQTDIPPGGEFETQVVQTVPLSGGQALVVAVQTPGIITPTASARGVTDEEFAGDPVHGYGFNLAARADVVDTGHLVLFGPVEVYDPAGTPALAPRFFVVYEGEDRPVGFGKPETEGAVFGVQAALGNYRDLTFAEYASVDGPLPDFTP
jgi:hypothetical protein